MKPPTRKQRAPDTTARRTAPPARRQYEDEFAPGKAWDDFHGGDAVRTAMQGVLLGSIASGISDALRRTAKRRGR